MAQHRIVWHNIGRPDGTRIDIAIEDGVVAGFAPTGSAEALALRHSGREDAADAGPRGNAGSGALSQSDCAGTADAKPKGNTEGATQPLSGYAGPADAKSRGNAEGGTQPLSGYAAGPADAKPRGNTRGGTQPQSGSADSVELRDGTGLYISSGWIDLHVHAFAELDPYGDEIDEIGVRQGVATIVDAGSCGADRIGELAAAAAQADTNVLALLNVSRIGLNRIDELSDLSWLDRTLAAQAIRDHAGFVVGLKARMSGSVVKGNGLEPLRIALAVADEARLPLMVHIGSAPPRVQDILPLLREGDAVTHYLNGKPNNLFDADGQPLPELVQAVRRGVCMDVGHGTASFSFRAAEAAKASGIRFDTISSDIYRGNRRNGPVRSLAHVMSKLLLLGYPLADVVDAVTVRAAQWLNKPELGRIKVGDKANLTLFEVRKGCASFVDSEGEAREGDYTIEAKGVYVNGRYVKC